jgi:undecaprenyl-diphosphatase
MLEQELHWERGLFFFLNGSDSVFWDNFFWIYTHISTWIPLYLSFFFVFMYKKHWKEIAWTLLTVALVIVLTDQISSHIFKPLFHRFRPTWHPDFMDQVDIVFGYRGGMYGFISGHAANSFGFAAFTALLFRKRLFTGVVLMFAILNSYSRIYIGVHFISDVVVGALVGAAVGYAGYLFYNWGRFRFFHINKEELKKPAFPAWEINIPCFLYGLSLLILLLFNSQIVNLTGK